MDRNHEQETMRAMGKNVFVFIGAIMISTLFGACSVSEQKDKELQLRDDENKTASIFCEKEYIPEKENITFRVLEGDEITVARNRLSDTERINNRWNIEEIDAIINPLQGKWKTEKYMGYILSDLCKFLPDDNIDAVLQEILLKEYESEVREAESKVPDIRIVIQADTKHKKANIIHVNNYESPFSIILSIARINDYYPIYQDTTTYSESFYVEYPVVYIKLFAKLKEGGNDIYKPATVIISADNQVLLLIDGAFYSLERY